MKSDGDPKASASKGEAPSPPTDATLALIDGATPALPQITAESESIVKIATSLDMPLERRIEAYEDIVDSEVGDTVLTRARNVEREVGLRQIYLKFEGGNPTGTQKDRIAFAQVMDALRRGFDAVTVATCGNYGAAVALAASLAGLRCVIYIPESYKTKRVTEMTQHGAEIIRVPGDYETTVRASSERAEKDEIYDANPGATNVAIQLRAYGEIAYEIYDELRDAPGTVSVPVSNGTCLAGIWKGFQSLYRRGKTSHMPRIIAGSASGKNPIVQAYLTNSETCQDLNPERIRETAVNEPLVNWHSFDGEHALEAIRQSSGWAANASDREMTQWAKTIRDWEGLSVLPASTAGLIALLDGHKKEPLPGDRHVVVLTGRKA